MNNKKTDLDSLMPLIKERLSSGHSVTFSPRGISMLPMLRQGKDTVTLSPITAPLKKYDLPLYRRDDGKFVLHRIVAVGEDYSCIGDNQYYLESGLRHDQMIAVVSKFKRGKRVISVNSLWYKLYCRFWHNTRPFRFFCIRAVAKIRRILKIK